MIIANEELQLASLKPGDVRIDVIMGDITTADFERVPETVPLGVDGGPQDGRRTGQVLGARGAVRRLAYRRDAIPED